MTLRRQLFLISLLMLTLPWAGLQFLREVETALRQGQEQALAATVTAVAAALAAEPASLYPYPERLTAGGRSGGQIYLSPLEQPPRVDGYADDWGAVPGQPSVFANGAASPSLKAGFVSGQLFLLLEVTDAELVYHNPGASALGSGDRLELHLGDGRRLVLATSAPGGLWARYRDARGRIVQEPAVRAHWQDRPSGYAVELVLPLALTRGRLGLTVVDAGAGTDTIHSNTLPAGEPPWLVYPPPQLSDRLAGFVQPGLKLSVVDPYGWRLAERGRVDDYAIASGHWLLRALYRSLLAPSAAAPLPAAPTGRIERPEVETAMQRDDAAGRWYRQAAGRERQLLSVAAPIVSGGGQLGAVIAEQSSEQFLALTGGAFQRLLGYGLAALAVAGGGLLGYAGWLSWRVRRLSRAAGAVMAEDGQVLNNFPTSRAADEIGDLTRNYARLLARIRAYTEYLRTLSRKLSHELRTPLAVVHSSLDNLAATTDTEQAATYRRRAKEGAERLSAILTAMSEATRVEESIQSAEMERVELGSLLADMVSAYRGVYPQHRLELSGAGPAPVDGAPELLVQMLDKLMDNAADFCPLGGRVGFAYEISGNFVQLSVSNEGPALPAAMAEQLFDNMVSLRSADDSGSHLGLGLHIVRLIVDYHRGTVRARNLADGTGVSFDIVLPLAEGPG